MKQALTLILLVLFMTTACKKDDVAPIDQLPAATREGKNTFGCLINGNAFIPKGSMWSGANRESYYQFVEGKYYFHISAEDKSDPNNIYAIRINAKDFEIKGTGTYKLGNVESVGIPFGSYAMILQGQNGSNEYISDPALGGELTITRFDLEKNIVSGTFWFDAVNDNGEKVEIREGRFDMNFTR